MTRHNPNRQTTNHYNQPRQSSTADSHPPTNTIITDGQGQLCGIKVQILPPRACEEAITAATKYLYETHGFRFTDRNLLAEALQPVISEDIAVHDDRASGLILASQFRAAQKAGRIPSSRNYYQLGVCNNFASNAHQAQMCVKYGLHRFMFVRGYDDATGDDFVSFKRKMLADTMEALMGVIREKGIENGRNDLEVLVERWMSVFELDWEAARRHWEATGSRRR